MVYERSARTYKGRPIVERDTERRARFIEAGLDVFVDKGYQSSTVVDVCKKAKLSTRQFYLYYSDREDLLAEIYRRVNEVGRKAVIEVLARPALPFPEKMRLAVRAYAESMTEDPRVIRFAATTVAGVSEAFEQRRAEERERWVFGLNALAAGAIAAGEIPDRDYTLSWAALMGAIHSLAALYCAKNSTLTFEQILSEVDYIVVGLLAKPPAGTLLST